MMETSDLLAAAERLEKEADELYSDLGAHCQEGGEYYEPVDALTYALAARILRKHDAVLAALRRVEWNPVTGSMGSRCRVCHNSEHLGHTPHCIIGKALNDERKGEPTSDLIAAAERLEGRARCAGVRPAKHRAKMMPTDDEDIEDLVLASQVLRLVHEARDEGLFGALINVSERKEREGKVPEPLLPFHQHNTNLLRQLNGE